MDSVQHQPITIGRSNRLTAAARAASTAAFVTATTDTSRGRSRMNAPQHQPITTAPTCAVRSMTCTSPPGAAGHVRGMRSPMTDRGCAWPQGRKAARPQGRKAARPQGRKAARPQGRKAARPQGRKAARPQGRKAARPQGRKAARPQGRKAARPQGRKAARPQGHCTAIMRGASARAARMDHPAVAQTAHRRVCLRRSQRSRLSVAGASTRNRSAAAAETMPRRHRSDCRQEVDADADADAAQIRRSANRLRRAAATSSNGH